MAVSPQAADQPPVDTLAPIFAALGDTTRLGIVNRLQQLSPQPISQLTQHTQLTRQAVTRHLQVLTQAGIVRANRSGREQHYRLEPAAMAAAQRYLDQVAQQWDNALDRLENFLDE